MMVIIISSIFSQNYVAFGHGIVNLDTSQGLFNTQAKLFGNIPSLQEFVPSASNLIAIDVLVRQCGGDPWIVNIYSGPFESRQLVHTKAHTVITNAPVGLHETEHIDLVPIGQEQSAIPLVPGQTYIMEIIGNGPNDCEWVVGQNINNSPGRFFRLNTNTNAFQEFAVDAGFRTYFADIPTPENSPDNGQAIGGKILAVDTVSLLLIGFDENLTIILPLMVVGSIITAVIIEKRKN